MRILAVLLILMCLTTACEKKEDPPAEPSYPIVTQVTLSASFYTYKEDSVTGERFFRTFHFSPLSFPDSIQITTFYYPTAGQDLNYFTYKHKGTYTAELIQEDATTKYLRVTNNFCKTEKKCAASCVGATVPCEEWQTESFVMSGDASDEGILTQDETDYPLYNRTAHSNPDGVTEYAGGVYDEDGDQIPAF